MAQFDLYRNPNPDTNASIPKPMLYPNPVLEVNGERFVLSAAELAGVPAACLGESTGNLQGCRNEIIAALVFVFNGV